MDVRRVLPPDAIQSIDNPEFAATHDGDPDDRVVVLDTETGPARAYPVLILNYHEIVNDSLGEEPIAVTWCPLCGSAVVYDRVTDGRELTFGVSGKLADDDLVMYDRETESEWKQSTGECIAGPLEGHTLTIRPATMTAASTFAEEYPEGRYLAPPEGKRRVTVPTDDGDLATELRDIDYSEDHFADYVDGDWLGSRSRDAPRSWDRTDLAPKEVVLGIELGDEAVGVPYSSVGADNAVDLSVGGTDVVILEADGDLHAFEDPGFHLAPVGNGRYDGDGTTWNGATGRAADGRRLSRTPTRRLFAFAWQSDHGPESFLVRG